MLKDTSIELCKYRSRIYSYLSAITYVIVTLDITLFVAHFNRFILRKKHLFYWKIIFRGLNVKITLQQTPVYMLFYNFDNKAVWQF